MPSIAGSRVLAQLRSSAIEESVGKKKATNVIGSDVGKLQGKELVKVDSPVPPGLSLPQDFPPLAAPSRPPPASWKPTQVPTNIKPAVPVFLSSKTQTPAAANTIKDSQPGMPAVQERSVEGSKGVAVDEPESAPDTNPTKESLVKVSSDHVQPEKDRSSVSEFTLSANPTDGNSKVKTSQKASEKRQIPGKLDIAATKSQSKEKVGSKVALSQAPKAGEASFTSRAVKDSLDSQPPTPTRTDPQSTQAIASRIETPRRLQAGSTTKENNVANTAVASSPIREPATTISTKQNSRRPSLTSIQGPGTPISEKVSDNASLTSTSISRTNSPPPTKVGTAPIRPLSKAQQKRERQARAREAEKSKTEEEPIKSIVEEPVQAPIVGRKKKTKKVNPSRGTADSTPAVTRPSSPTQLEETTDNNLPSLPATPVKEPKKREMVQTETNSPATPDTPAPTSQTDPAKPTLTAASIFADLQKSGDLPPTIENLFKNVASSNYRFDITPADFEAPTIPSLTADQARALARGECLLFEFPNRKPAVMMPNRQILIHPSKQEAERYIQLRKTVMNTGAPFRFTTAADEELLQLRYPPYSTDNAPPALGTSEATDLMNNRFVDESTAGQQEVQSPVGQQSEEWPQELVVEEAEEALSKARKEHEVLEKKLNALLKKNRRLVLGGGH